MYTVTIYTFIDVAVFTKDCTAHSMVINTIVKIF